MKEYYGSPYNILGLGGPGTYCILGPTEAGKTFFTKQIYHYAISPSVKKEYRLHFEDIIILSATSKINEEYDWAPESTKKKPTNEAINEILAVRKMEMKEECEALGWPLNQREKWAEAHPIMIVMDDTYGMVDFTTPGNSCSKLATKARHYGIYFVLCAQYIKQLGPVFHDNARAWVCFSCNAENHKDIILKHHGKIPELLKIVTSHNRRANHIIIYFTTWRFRKAFGVTANRVLKMFPIPEIDKAVLSKGSDDEKESRYGEEDDADDFSE